MLGQEFALLALACHPLQTIGKVESPLGRRPVLRPMAMSFEDPPGGFDMCPLELGKIAGLISESGLEESLEESLKERDRGLGWGVGELCWQNEEAALK